MGLLEGTLSPEPAASQLQVHLSFLKIIDPYKVRAGWYLSVPWLSPHVVILNIFKNIFKVYF